MSDELKRCELEETESYKACYADYDGELKRATIHVLECSECGRTCEHVNGTYPRCPYCSAVNVLDENYEPKAIPGDELEMIRMAEKYQLADDDEVKRSDDGADSRGELEADVLERVKEGFITYTELIGWLDRQKRITIREHQEGCKYKAKADELQERVDSLTAECDRLRRFVDGGAYDCATCEAKAELAERADSLEAELARKQHVCDVQRDSFLKLEVENAELRRALDGASDALESI